MANKVYANGREISCKAADGKAICAFPDVCLSPPSPPAGPIPIPYPNTAFAKDTTSGSKTVKISNKEVMLKRKSYFKKSTGDEAATKSLGMGVITHQITGKVYFNSWSPDVKFEGQNVVRHLDLTTHNHASSPGQTPPWPYVDGMAADLLPDDHPCKKDMKKEETACEDCIVRFDKGKGNIAKGKTKLAVCANTPEGKKCRDARKCKLTPQENSSCCTDEEAHHLIEAHGFIKPMSRNRYEATPLKKFSGNPPYRPGDAPCVCAKGNRWTAEHGAFHALIGQKENASIKKNGKKEWDYGTAKKASSNAHKKIFPESKCNKECIEKQLDEYHNKIGANDSTSIRAETAKLEEWMKKDEKEVIAQMNKDLIGKGWAGGVR